MEHERETTRSFRRYIRIMVEDQTDMMVEHTVGTARLRHCLEST